jgi:hypothetical protein
MKYQSSKGPIEIAEMVTPHLANAWRKLDKQVEVVGDDTFAEVRDALCDELLRRGCTLDLVSGQWHFPQKPEIDPEAT